MLLWSHADLFPHAVLIALALLEIVLYYGVVALEKIFAGWAEREIG